MLSATEKSDLTALLACGSIVMIPTVDEEFRTIMAALTSNNDRWGIRHISIVLAPEGQAPLEQAGEGSMTEGAQSG